MSKLRLDLNENPLGPSPAALAAAHRAIAFCHRYPDQQEQALKRCLADCLNVSPEQITLGNGSDDLLTQIASIYLQKKNSALLAQHSFLGLQRILENSPGQLKRVTLSFTNMAIEPFLSAIDPTTRLLFIINPNNPTGHYFNTQQLESLLQQVPPTVLVIIDEAYAEYATAADYPHTCCWINRYPNLIVSRTFSKFYGLAGLRLGYTISQPTIAHRLQRNRLPFALNSIALSAAQAALHDTAHSQATQINHQTALTRLQEGLQKLTLTTYPTQTNFVCVDLKKASLPLCQQLYKRGIRVRSLDDHKMPNHLRISVGLPEQITYFLEVLQQVLI